MAPMVRLGFRPGPSALRPAAAAARGECTRWPSMRALQSRGIATGPALRETNVELPGSVPPVQTPSRQAARERIQAIEKAKPFSEFLTDKFQRQHDYLRISITERCNLRCLYCMPEEGIPLSPPATMLTTPEIFYLSSLFVSQGVTKIRLTGGEPTVRRDIIPLMQQIGSLRPKGLRELALTTNGISLHRKLDAMVEAGLTGVNLSLDTLDPFQFQIMTRRKGFDAVMKSIDRVLEMNKLGANIKLKVNCVVMRGLNEREIIPFVEMGREKDIEVRFIEYMPFGGNKWSENKMISFQEMVDTIRTKYPGLERIPGHKNDTSKTFQVPGFVGKVGFITSMTNDFCSTCNRLRITSDGNLKVCLHGNDEVSLRDLLRQDNNNEPIDEAAFERIKQTEIDRASGLLNDATALGWGPRERELLSVIGQAVKRKAEKHADMGDLANMQNRPMILIGNQHVRGSSESNRGPNHWRIAQTASSILASNAHLNPLLTTTSSSVRCFSTASPFRVKNEMSDLHDPVEDKINASIEKKYQESLGRHRAEAAAARVEARIQRRREKAETASEPALSPSTSPERQAIQKTALIRDLRTQFTPTVEEPAAQAAPAALEGLSLEALNARLADLRAKLAEAEAISWKELFEETARSFSVKDLPNYSNMKPDWRGQIAKEFDQKRIASLKQVRSDQKAHFQETKQLTESVVALGDFIKQQQQQHVKSDTKSRMESKAGTGAPTKDGARSVEDAEDNRRRLEAIQSRRAELLRRKDAIAVKMAQLTAPTTSSPPPAKKWGDQLRLFVPKGKKIVIDRFLTVNFDAPDYELAWQVQAMRVRLRKFTPPLDALPLPVKMSNEQQLRTWLKVLVARYQDKTGVKAGILDAEGGQWEELSLEEAQRMAVQENESTWRERGSTGPSGQMTMAQRKQQVRERRAAEEELRRARRERQVARRRAYAKDLEKLYLEHGAYPAAIRRAEQRLRAKAAERAAWLLKVPPSPSPSPLPSLPDSQPPIRVVLARSPGTPTESSGLRNEYLHAGQRGSSPSPPPPAESTELRLKGNLSKLHPSTSRKLVRGYSTSSSSRSPSPSPDDQDDQDDLNAQLKAKEAKTRDRDPSSPSPSPSPQPQPLPSHLPHLTRTGTAHMVPITHKPYSTRTAVAVGSVFFSNSTPLQLITSNALKKGDVLSVSRIAGIMAAKKCPDLVPLCHPIALTHVGVEVRTFSPLSSSSSSSSAAGADGPEGEGSRDGDRDDLGHGGVRIECTVACTGATGVEMEALTAVMGAALSVVDMCKAVDKFQRIGGVRVVLKEGGKSGVWREEGWASWQTQDGE
ncbi:hypothetical protein B5807_06996 [Epicoccum nigrum]|uniref:Radical SAM core domain-containing protein n=1 Tax=Epicoccum nigrum TaxID=105696 RepID=A0A1Y2LXC1_EPING|nr:hypothetical protein B5807_06996 [Epicoccum nigrum]